uniref:Uncharacterized protein n=1 Tax=Timema poppense TaxID=170557 RepID=A0A7R9GYF0_TIMPO|nr:unnamed protein product [Timema poppensis]
MKSDPCKPQACRIQKCLKVISYLTYYQPSLFTFYTNGSDMRKVEFNFLTEEWTLYERLTVECDSTLDCLRCVRNLQLLMHYV